ncbi:kinase-like protein [Sphaerulina musiva SO2202]|uniref:Kinase-like protein n=1 Tax=Sphaerulina musiva (strain SO2202) TaxID=692275 RepID=M3B8B5_SPHMS|nr:kinase-like protein [Sphaerulina musiva SO2202]EMF16087.1 kinase-like protein [Sphaerulina musiva SO2202]
MGDDLEVIAGGSTGLIKLRTDNSFVEKAPHPNDKTVEANLEDLRREYVAYSRLPRHPRVLQLHSHSTPQRLVLPYLRNGCLRDFLRYTSSSSSSSRRLQFAADAAESLSILHSVQIIHGDINSWNFLLTDDFRLCIIDFSGSTIDGSAGSGFEGFRYCLPRSFHDPSTVRTDLFALGSLLYEIMTGETPYQSCEDQEVEEYFRKGIFPTTKDVPLLGSVMLGCWRGAYESAEAVYEDIKKQQEAV